MDDTAQDTGETDEFSRLLAQLQAPSTPPVVPPAASISAAETAPPPFTRPIAPERAAPTARAPELMGADELAAAPRPFPPAASDAPPLVTPPALDPRSVDRSPPAASVAQAPAASPAPAVVVSTDPAQSVASPPDTNAASALDFAALLAGASATASAGPSSSAARRSDAASSPDDESPDIGRSNVGEKLVLILAILLPPLGLLGAIVGSALSLRRRGWVIGLLKAALAVGIVMSLVVGVAGYVGYTRLRAQQLHDQIAASSAAFCSTIAADPSMVQLPDFGWPPVAASIPDSLTAMQAYEDRWQKLTAVSPEGIKGDTAKVAAAAKQILESVAVARTIDDAANVATMSSVASSGIPAWHREYCG